MLTGVFSISGDEIHCPPLPAVMVVPSIWVLSAHSSTVWVLGKQRVIIRLSLTIRPAAHVLSGAFHSMAIDLQTLKHKTGEITPRFNNRDNSHERRGICRWYRNII
jgi:hypothetical protein